MNSLIAITAAFLLGCAAACATDPAKPSDAPIPPDHAEKMAKGLKLFDDHVAALLNEHCVKCHGGEKTKGGLDLTSREALLKGGEDGTAVVLGKARESLLYKLITHSTDPHMPSKGEKLPDAAIAQIAAWIDAGAPYGRPLIDKGVTPKGRSTVTEADRQFWAFQPLKKVSPPKVGKTSWCRTPVDRFILAKLEEKRLSPNPVADRRKLIRRAYFDLIGLPPTPEEVTAFVNDRSPDAYSKLVDHLLDSPHYGERWARHWLDIARFAESHGFEHDTDRPSAYHYRDFVIQALNQDMPYDRFVKWQIAGDEMEPENILALKATGFLAAGVHATQITANQAEKERYDELDDIVSTIGTSMLGMTIGCARCHDHKFDPIPTANYYRFLSTFTTTVRTEIDWDFHPERYREAKAKHDQEHEPLVAALDHYETGELSKRLDHWIESNTNLPPPKWTVLEMSSAKSEGGATLTKQDDGSYLASGKNPKSDTYTFVAKTTLKGVTAIRLEVMADKSLPKNGPGRADNGNFALSDFQVSASALDGKSEAVLVKLVNARATFEQGGLPVKAAIDDDKKSGWAVDGQIGTNQAAVFELETPLADETGATLTFTLKFDTNDKHAIGRPRLAITAAPLPASLEPDPVPQPIFDILAARRGGLDKLEEAQRATLMKWYRGLDADWVKLSAAVQEHEKKKPKPEMTKVLISSEGLPAVRLNTQGPDFYEKTYFLKRGDPNQKQSEATPGYLQVLMRSPETDQHWQAQPPKGWRTSYRRTSLANWITDVDEGAGQLLARVIVNRLWQHHLGRGIVSTPSDFGVQGERPTHPELLDWLANELIQNGWKLKPIHKLIMTSAVYMQGNEVSPKGKEDPDNTLYWRRAPGRLEGEVIRDSMLAVSGLLDSTMYGPGTLDESMKRRSIYFTVKRSKMIPVLTQFDGPDGLQGLGRRATTTIAPQALLMMNNDQVRERARAFAKRVMPKAGQSVNDAVRLAYRTAFGRLPDRQELADTREFLKQQSEAYQKDGKTGPLEMAWADFCQTLMSLNEFIYID